MDLPITTPVVFSVFVEYIYTEKWDPEEHETNTVVGLAILASKALMLDLHNSVIKALKTFILNFGLDELDLNTINWKWFCKATEPGSPIRRLMVDCWAFDVSTGYLEEEGKDLPRQMLHEIAIVKGRYTEYASSVLEEATGKALERLPSRAEVLEDDSYLRQTDKPEEHFWWELAKTYIPPPPPSP